MRFEVQILGCGSSTPSLLRNPAAQIVNVQENYFLVDCGEGTQLQMRKYKIRMQRIHHVFISHLHGDHYLGLIGLIQSMHLLGRKNDLHIYSDSQLESLIDQHLKVSYSKLNFNLIFHSLNFDSPQVIFENKVVSVSTVILKHRIPCCGFIFKEKVKPKKINKEKTDSYAIPVHALSSIKSGMDYKLTSGEIIKNDEITFPSDKSYSYAYCSDTAFSKKIISEINGVDVLYHESTFTEEMKDRAKETFHSTATQAAQIALEANVDKLVLGHFSVRYKSLENFLKQSTEIFPNTILGEDGMVIKLY